MSQGQSFAFRPFLHFYIEEYIIVKLTIDAISIERTLSKKIPIIRSVVLMELKIDDIVVKGDCHSFVFRLDCKD